MTNDFSLLLMRHAKSDWHSHRADFERPLNERGRKDALRMGAYLAENKLIPDVMLVSAAERTMETAHLLVQQLPVDEDVIVADKELYLASRETLCENIEYNVRAGQRLLVLAHNPGMDSLVSYFSAQEPLLTSSGKLMTTSAVANFHMASADALTKPGQGELLGLYRAKEIY